jgi:Uma2 family endonuclease
LPTVDGGFQLVLAVEILSPSTRRKDLLLKRSKYQDTGVVSYWVIDPDPPSFTAFELIDGRYQSVAHANHDENVDLTTPFALRLTPSALVAR